MCQRAIWIFVTFASLAFSSLCPFASFPSYASRAYRIHNNCESSISSLSCLEGKYSLITECIARTLNNALLNENAVVKADSILNTAIDLYCESVTEYERRFNMPKVTSLNETLASLIKSRLLVYLSLQKVDLPANFYTENTTMMLLQAIDVKAGNGHNMSSRHMHELDLEMTFGSYLFSTSFKHDITNSVFLKRICLKLVTFQYFAASELSFETDGEKAQRLSKLSFFLQELSSVYLRLFKDISMHFWTSRHITVQIRALEIICNVNAPGIFVLNVRLLARQSFAKSFMSLEFLKIVQEKAFENSQIPLQIIDYIHLIQVRLLALDSREAILGSLNSLPCNVFNDVVIDCFIRKVSYQLHFGVPDFFSFLLHAEWFRTQAAFEGKLELLDELVSFFDRPGPALIATKETPGLQDSFCFHFDKCASIFAKSSFSSLPFYFDSFLNSIFPSLEFMATPRLLFHFNSLRNVFARLIYEILQYGDSYRHFKNPDRQYEKQRMVCLRAQNELVKWLTQERSIKLLLLATIITGSINDYICWYMRISISGIFFFFDNLEELNLTVTNKAPMFIRHIFLQLVASGQFICSQELWHLESVGTFMALRHILYRQIEYLKLLYLWNNEAETVYCSHLPCFQQYSMALSHYYVQKDIN